MKIIQKKKFLQFSVTMYIWLIKKFKLYATSKTISLFLLEIFFLFLSFTLSVRQQKTLKQVQNFASIVSNDLDKNWGGFKI